MILLAIIAGAAIAIAVGLILVGYSKLKNKGPDVFDNDTYFRNSAYDADDTLNPWMEGDRAPSNVFMAMDDSVDVAVGALNFSDVRV